ncbi:MAG TPA: biotin/lipoyl-containing protein [Gemmatimonadales bacterium]|nr:biotin/lipoyl-containing protein [Gemmatimonadales bacterium]
MKYAVLIAGQSIEVEIEGERVRVGDRTVTASLELIPGTPLRQLVLEGRPLTFSMESVGRGRWRLQSSGEWWEAEVLDERTRHIRSLTAAGDHRRTAHVLKAPMPGLVVRVLTKAGESISAGTGVVVLEAMKMENELKATGAAVVKAVRVEPGQAVEKGQTLVEFEQE